MTNPLPQRKSPRLKGYDYSQSGAYFVTICCHQRVHLFGDVADGEMMLDTLGCIVETCWDDLPNHYDNIRLDAFVVMPNHVHGIIFISGGDGVGEGLKPSPAPTTTKRHGLTEIVRGLKNFSARKINQLRDTPGTAVWQRSFHDHIIRSEKSLNHLREYVENNPARWQTDTFYA